MRQLSLTILLLSVGAFSPGRLVADESELDGSEARSILSQPLRYPWYDAAQDDFRRLQVRQPEPPKLPEPPEFEISPLNWLPNPLSLIDFTIWTLLVVLLVVIAVLLIRAYLRRESRGAARNRKSSRRIEPVRVDALPPVAEPTDGDWLAEARRRASSGDYSQAMIYLYSHLLIELDRQQRIHLARGKTNRQYLRELRGAPPLAGCFESCMIAFEEVFFGHRPLPPGRFSTLLGMVEPVLASIPKGDLR